MSIECLRDNLDILVRLNADDSNNVFYEYKQSAHATISDWTSSPTLNIGLNCSYTFLLQDNKGGTTWNSDDDVAKLYWNLSKACNNSPFAAYLDGVTWKNNSGGAITESRPTVASHCYLTLPNNFTNFSDAEEQTVLFAGIRGSVPCDVLNVRGSCLCLVRLLVLRLVHLIRIVLLGPHPHHRVRHHHQVRRRRILQLRQLALLRLLVRRHQNRRVMRALTQYLK
jgi:hypothetical protein